MERWLPSTDYKKDKMNAMTEENTDNSHIPAQVESNTPAFAAEGISTPASSTRKSRPLPDDAMIIVPVRNMVLFPGAVVPLTIGRKRSIAAAQQAARGQHPIGVLLQRQGDIEDPGPNDLHWVGTTANVVRYITAPDGAHHLICQGEERFRVLEFLELRRQRRLCVRYADHIGK